MPAVTERTHPAVCIPAALAGLQPVYAEVTVWVGTDVFSAQKTLDLHFFSQEYSRLELREATLSARPETYFNQYSQAVYGPQRCTTRDAPSFKLMERRNTYFAEQAILTAASEMTTVSDEKEVVADPYIL
ncbi:hypothetical protein CC80DRAFT_543332 [Byssothecium circinans]|uniref:Uncharacterized protein n=1 Tax=Byssothecium circinans TaxID=147558 RepID=A0A6A5UCA3_9PLEO|nr:hypothetical protein CC80DRAFT_543332 [Byssothecium circinans]